MGSPAVSLWRWDVQASHRLLGLLGICTEEPSRAFFELQRRHPVGSTQRGHEPGLDRPQLRGTAEM